MSSEQYGFVVAVVFLLIFSAMVSTMPAGLSGSSGTPQEIGNISPSLTGDFTSKAWWKKSNYTGSPIASWSYDLNDLHWSTFHSATGYFYVAAKDYIGGVLWLGGYWYCDFQAPDGTNRGSTLTLSQIDADSNEGSVSYSMMFHANGKSAGTFVVGWNASVYSSASDAWTAGAITFVHGVGFNDKSTNNIGALIVGLLTFSVPDIPVLVGLFLGAALWANIFFVL